MHAVVKVFLLTSGLASSGSELTIAVPDTLSHIYPGLILGTREVVRVTWLSFTYCRASVPVQVTELDSFNSEWPETVTE